MTDAAPTSSMAQLLALIQGNQAPPQYPVQTSTLAGPGFMGPLQQADQPMPAGLPANVMALWASMTPQMRAQYLAASTQGAPTAQQLASTGGKPAAPTNLSLTPAMLQQFTHLQPQVPYGDPMTLNPNDAYLARMEAWSKAVKAGQGIAQASTEE